MVKHSLANGEYNSRRAECEEAVRVLAHFLPQARALRDVTLADLAHYGGELRPSFYKRYIIDPIRSLQFSQFE